MSDELMASSLPLQATMGFADVRGRRIAGWFMPRTQQQEAAVVEILVGGERLCRIPAKERWNGPLPAAATHVFCGFHAMLPQEGDVSRHVVVRVEGGPVLLERKVSLGFFQKAHLEGKVYDGRRLEGWAWHPGADRRVEIEVTFDDEPAFVVRTDRYRRDLHEIGFGEAMFGYSIELKHPLVPPNARLAILRSGGLVREIRLEPQHPDIIRGSHDGLSARLFVPAPDHIVTI